MTESLDHLMQRHRDKVQQALNLLVESPYFYKSDNELLFYFVNRHKRAFEKFFADYYDWKFFMDGKCARVYKARWYNREITPKNRDIFNFTKRDEAMAFMMLLEFFEKQIDEQAVSVEENENLMFRYGDLFEYVHRRFASLFDNDERYSGEYLRAKALGPIMPKLERYRFIKKVPVPPEDVMGEDEYLYEALPALYHFNTETLSRSLSAAKPNPNRETDEHE
ncbi:DUF2398 family protein [Acanthopleuribacter pedis]|uniref:DUF2398 family protein n=1 Tax=Acanthopleuribacter pedis TaxID=442870 RepID=A0A8J7QC40_9BACT|nr:DUF2398 family protein [Acanthopleuribacter pedis]MBO1322921.1 DUF2398 family protein [Acanthopleuribacter pedis]